MPARPVFRQKPNAVEAIFGRRRAVIGVIHSLPLPGAPDYDGMAMDEIVRSPPPRPGATGPAAWTG